MPLPNVVIAGTPKSGTTSLYRWLADHPQVSVGDRKETRYLMDPDHPLCAEENLHTAGIEGYERLFPERSADEIVTLEATPHYLYQQTALEVLAELPSQPLVIVALRDPAERVYSSYRYTKHNLGQVPQDFPFRAFLSDLYGGKNDPQDAPLEGPTVQREVRYSVYWEYLERWMNRLSAERLPIVLFDDIRANPADVLRQLAAACGIEAAFYNDYQFTHRNETYAVRNPRLLQRAQRLAGRIPAGRTKQKLKQLFLKTQRTGRPQQSDDDAAALAELRQQYRPHNERLSQLISRDLTHWNHG